MSNKKSNVPKESIWIPLPKDYGKKKLKQVTGSICFECKRCSRCCSQFDIWLSPAEYERIARLGREYFTKIHFSLLKDTEIGAMAIRKFIRGNRWVCAFLGEGNECKIYQIRPSTCKNYPFFLIHKFESEVKAGKLPLMDETHVFVVGGISHYLFYDMNCPGVKEVDMGGVDLKSLARDLFERNLDTLEAETYPNWYREEVNRIQSEIILKDKETLVEIQEFNSAFERGDFVEIEGQVCDKFRCKRVLLYLVPSLKPTLNRMAIEEIAEDERTMVKSLEAEGVHSALLFWDLFSDEKHVGKVLSMIRDEEFVMIVDGKINLEKIPERMIGRKLIIKHVG